MPSRKGKKKKGRKGRKKGKGGEYSLVPLRNYSLVNRTGYPGFTPRFETTFHYASSFQVSNATTVATQQTFNLNSLFDPDRTGTGHQPYPYDLIGGVLYNRYRVLRAKWRVCIGPANNTVEALAVPMNSLPPVSITDKATFEAAKEFWKTKSKMVPATGQDVTFSGNNALNALAGATITEYKGDDRYEAVYSASPSEVIALVVAVYNANSSTVITNYSVFIDYEVDLHDLITAGVSYQEHRVEYLRKAYTLRGVNGVPVFPLQQLPIPEVMTEMVQQVVSV